MSKRILILLGAGAAYHWFDKSKGISASTDDITEEIVSKIKFCNNLNIRLKKDLLTVNFETIINEVEDLFLYYYALLPPMDDNFTRNFEKEEWINKFFDTEDINRIKDKLYAIFKSCISIIISKIRRYDACIKCDWNSKTNDLKEFLLYLNGSEQENILRSFSLNYDQMLTDASSETQLNFFDGFEKPNSHINQNSLLSVLNHYSTENILKHTKTNCCYNLHGSIFWHWLEEFQQYVKSEYIFEKDEFKYIISNLTKSENGEQILKVPIITGFKKIQRLEFEPFNTMYKAFKNDCLSADAFFIIGYSFGDSHINNVLKSADIAKKKIVIVDCNENNKHVSPNLQKIIGRKNAMEIICGKNKEENIFYFKNGITEFLKKGQ